jgi:membrane protein implicated in regulation of membrane protease activity
VDLSHIYLICFGVGLFFAIVSAFFADVFGGHDVHHGGSGGHAEAGFDAHGMPGFAPLNPTTIASFITAFGGFGLLFLQIGATSNPWINLPLAAVSGFVVAALVCVIFNKIFHATQSSSEGRVAELVGQSAVVITPIVPGGVGEIAYVQGGTRYTAPARSSEATQIPSGTNVWIVRVDGTDFYVANQ